MVKNKTKNNKKITHNKTVKHAVKKISVKKKNHKEHKKTISNNHINSTNNNNQSPLSNNIGSEYKKGLLNANRDEDKYNKLFEQKLAEQYKEFRNIKEHNMQSKKFLKVLMVIITVIILALLLLSYS